MSGANEMLLPCPFCGDEPGMAQACYPAEGADISALHGLEGEALETALQNAVAAGDLIACYEIACACGARVSPFDVETGRPGFLSEAAARMAWNARWRVS